MRLGRATFGQAALLEHEDNEMMRPLNVLPRGGAVAGDGGSLGVPETGTASTDAG
ncbi:hypothetical protein [Micromonospora sp. NBC_01638]|uniref:hypothetical protein n=1 Tax=Micromonospora sp. NBC_01638 TaxID=2975982 RepID=UPI003867615F|nr:hypothetical protein OG811_20850 [Micromonospora sp. NBC_01638]